MTKTVIIDHTFGQKTGLKPRINLGSAGLLSFKAFLEKCNNLQRLWLIFSSGDNRTTFKRIGSNSDFDNNQL
jgi:hypothetical protein